MLAATSIVDLCFDCKRWHWWSGLAVYQPYGTAGFESRSDDTEVPRKGYRTAK
ncbi:hypothetical protein PR003_g19016 [Phytophthora rubi]|uniref:Uncharacterized protein n=1 Tax=Phytophthora rubi TaxID=129364 RepID=A0A6A4E2V5_9STRA|nr:hypothetical protein PR001_g15771 [Phytophthora rubi]KAE9315324.1 hypothetical protein PR003_g19016 [Phytophthora rubi]